MVLEILVICVFVADIIVTIATRPTAKKRNELNKEYNELLRLQNQELRKQNNILTRIVVQRKEKVECAEENTQNSSIGTTNLS